MKNRFFLLSFLVTNGFIQAANNDDLSSLTPGKSGLPDFTPLIIEKQQLSFSPLSKKQEITPLFSDQNIITLQHDDLDHIAARLPFFLNCTGFCKRVLDKPLYPLQLANIVESELYWYFKKVKNLKTSTSNALHKTIVKLILLEKYPHALQALSALNIYTEPFPSGESLITIYQSALRERCVFR